MQRPVRIQTILTVTSIFILACSASTLPDLSTPTPQTLVTIPPMPTSFATQPVESNDPELKNENLLAELPAGFKVDYQAEQGNQTITEMVAEGESVEDWTTLVTVQVYLGETNTTPQQAQQTLTDSWFAACENSEIYPIADGVENGYNFVLWQLYCPVNPATQKVEYTFMKAIEGNDSFYLVQVAFRYEPTDADITQWMEYLRDVQVCDSRLPEQACP